VPANPGPSAAPAPPSAGVGNVLEHPELARNGAELEQASLHRSLVALPLAAVLAGVLAYRPRRHHVPERNPEVVHTQIMLAIVGALVMLVVGASLARAFGIAGAASLVRYRAKVSDAKDASVMLSALGIGLASGVGLYYIASVSTLFIVLVLSGLEWVEPRHHDEFRLKVKHPRARELRPQVEKLLRRSRLRHELRTSADDELIYAVQVPVGRSLKSVSEAVTELDRSGRPGIEWEKDAD
jgi:uncharacterized membrane protein YhiD involved in acid resistance